MGADWQDNAELEFEEYVDAERKRWQEWTEDRNDYTAPKEALPEDIRRALEPDYAGNVVTWVTGLMEVDADV